MKTPGEIAYDAFRNSTNNYIQPDWGYSELHERVKMDWEAVGKAVLAWDSERKYLARLRSDAGIW